MQRDGLQILRIFQQHAPADHRRAKSETEKTQGRFTEYHTGDRQRDIYYKVAEKGRHEMTGYDCELSGARDFCRHDKLLFPQLEEFAPHDPRKSTPAHDGQDQRDDKVYFYGTPIVGHGRAKSHPERYGGDRYEKLHDSLDNQIYGATEISRNAPENTPHKKRQRYPDQAD